MNSSLRIVIFIGKLIFILVVALAALTGLGFWLAPDAIVSNSVHAPDGTLWTCSMHPQVRKDRPGLCDYCGMSLIPLEKKSNITDPLALDDAGRRVARVATVVLARGAANLNLRAVGSLVADERRVSRIAAWTAGRLDRVMLPAPGMRVEAGDAVAELYAPSLILMIAELKSSASLGAGVREAIVERIRRLGVRDAQINEWEKAAEVSPKFTIYSSWSGIVLERTAREGAFVEEGAPIAELATLDVLALDLDIYEKDAAFITKGAKLHITIPALGGRVLDGEVDYVKPMARVESRTVQVRAFIQNADGAARPGMWASADFTIPVDARGEARRAADSRPVEEPLLLPASALLDLGRRRIIYIQTAEGHYQSREVVLGPRVNEDSYIIISGATAGERVVARGAFLIDSQAQIEGKSSLIFTSGAGGGGK